jgi:hypothetical protein
MCGLVAYRHSDGDGEQVAAWMGFDLLEGAYDTAAFIRVLDAWATSSATSRPRSSGTTSAPITPATCRPGRPPSRGWSLRTCRRTRPSWTRWRGCGPT